MTEEKRKKIQDECLRESESCLYTSTTLFIWLRILRIAKIFFIVAPLVLGGLGAWELLTAANIASVKIFASSCSFLAGLLPAIYTALKFDDSLDSVVRYASIFKNLQDEFRQAALIYSEDAVPSFQEHFERLMMKLNDARSSSITPPEWVFKLAQKKVKGGDYSFDHDSKGTGAKQD
jgi:hypothetical protein